VNIRTLLLSFHQTAGVPTVPMITIIGGDTGFHYFENPFYLKNPTSDRFVLVVPIAASIDTYFVIAITNYFGLTWTLTVNGDTELYEESTLYNGQVLTLETIGAPQLIVDGPLRLISLWSLNGAVIIQGSTGNTLLNSPAAGSAQISFPPNTIISAGDNLTQAGAGYATVVYAYP